MKSPMRSPTRSLMRSPVKKPRHEPYEDPYDEIWGNLVENEITPYALPKLWWGLQKKKLTWKPMAKRNASWGLGHLNIFFN